MHYTVTHYKLATGECVGCIGFLYFMESAEVRDKYWKEDGSYTELGEAAFEKIQPVMVEFGQLAEWSTSYTDWLIQ